MEDYTYEDYTYAERFGEDAAIKHAWRNGTISDETRDDLNALNFYRQKYRHEMADKTIGEILDHFGISGYAPDEVTIVMLNAIVKYHAKHTMDDYRMDSREVAEFEIFAKWFREVHEAKDTFCL